MLSEPLEIEGSGEQIAAEALRYPRQKMRLTIFPETAEAPVAKDTRSLNEKLAEIASRIPAEELKSLPADFCEQLDHYLYSAN